MRILDDAQMQMAGCGPVPEDTRRKFGTVLRNLRRSQSVTQELLAERSGVSVESVRRLEAGANSPSLDTLCKLSSGLGLSLKSIFGTFTDVEGRSCELDLLCDYLSHCTDSQLKTASRIIHALVETEALFDTPDEDPATAATPDRSR